MLRRMLLAVDVGNTQTHLGHSRTGARHDWRLTTLPAATADMLAATVSDLLELRASVRSDRRGDRLQRRPAARPRVERLCSRHVDRPLPDRAPAVKTGMPILVDNPHELGTDRLVNANAPHAKVGGSLRVGGLRDLDRFDVVSGAGRVPRRSDRPGVEIRWRPSPRGPRSSQDRPLRPRGIRIGKHTQGAIRSGSPRGSPGSWTGSTGAWPRTSGAGDFLATGGLAPMIAPHSRRSMRSTETAHGPWTLR